MADIPDPPKEPSAPRACVNMDWSIWRVIRNDIEWSIYDFHLALWRRVYLTDAAFLGGPYDGLTLTVPRTAKEWIVPHRDGECRYARKLRISGTYFVAEHREDE